MGRRLLLAALLIAPVARAALFFEPVPLGAPETRIYRLATDGVRLFAGGSIAGYGYARDVEMVSTDGTTFTELPALPVAGISLGYADAEDGRLAKLIRISDDRAPRRYLVATYDTSRGAWGTGPALTIDGEASPGNLGLLGGVTYVGTTAGDLWRESGDRWERVPLDLPLPVKTYHRAPRLVTRDGRPYVVCDGGLGLLANGRIGSADPRLDGTAVLDVLEVDGALHVTRPVAGHLELLRLSRAALEVIASLDAEGSRGALFLDGDELYVAGPDDEPRLLTDGRLLSARAAGLRSPEGFHVTTGDGNVVPFRGAIYTTSGAVLHRGTRRVLRTLPAVVDAEAAGGGRYTTSLALLSLAGRDLVATLTFRDESGTATRSASPVLLSPGRPWSASDLADVLRLSGAVAPGAARVVGSLAIEITGHPSPREDEILAAAVITLVTSPGSRPLETPVPVLPSGSGADPLATLSSAATLPILAGDGFRTNVAVLNSGDGSGEPLASCHGTCGRAPQLILAAEDGSRTGAIPFRLSAGARLQWNAVASEGTSRAMRFVPPGGASWSAPSTDDLLAYSVVHDEGSGSGALLFASVASRDARRGTLLLPLRAGDARLLLTQSPEAPDSQLDVVIGVFGEDAPRTILQRLPAGASARVPLPAGAVFVTLEAASGARLSGLAAWAIGTGSAPRVLAGADAVPESRWSRGRTVVFPTSGRVHVLDPEPRGGPRLELEVAVHDAQGARLEVTGRRLVDPGGFASFDVPRGGFAVVTNTGEGRFVALDGAP